MRGGKGVYQAHQHHGDVSQKRLHPNKPKVGQWLTLTRSTVNVDPVNTNQRPLYVRRANPIATKGAPSFPGRTMAYKWALKPYFDYFNFISLNSPFLKIL